MARFKKAMGRIIGVELTKTEQIAMDKEIHRQLAVNARAHNKEIDATVLWVLHKEFGFGPERLRRFYDRFDESVEELIEAYEGDEPVDRMKLCMAKLKEYGVDLDEWEKERNSRK